MPKDKIYHAKVSVGCEMRAVDTDDGTMRVSGYAMLFDNPTVLYSIGRQNIMECIDSAALDGCDMSDVVFDRGHAMEDKLLARTKNNTLKLSVDNKGLYFEAEIANTQEGRDTYELIKRGDLCGCSFAASITEQSYDDSTYTYKILKFKKLFDVAAVTFPAYEDTELTAEQRSALGIDAIEELELEKAKLLACC